MARMVEAWLRAEKGARWPPSAIVVRENLAARRMMHTRATWQRALEASPAHTVGELGGRVLEASGKNRKDRSVVLRMFSGR
jgi:hypothetical protein